MGNLAKDCHRKKGIAPATSKGEDTIQVRQKKDARKRNVLYTIIVKARDILQVSALLMPCLTVTECFSDNPPFRCKEVVEGQFVNDIQIAQELW